MLSYKWLYCFCSSKVRDTPAGHHITVVISPLKSLIHDQVLRWKKLGVKAIAIEQAKDMAAEVVEGKINIK